MYSQEGSYADVLVKLGLIKLLQRRFDICEEACVPAQVPSKLHRSFSRLTSTLILAPALCSDNANASLTCPVKPGHYTLTQTVELPKEIPRAKFAIDVLGVTAEDEDMLCLKLYIGTPAFASS